MFLHRLKSYQIIVIIINQKVGFHFRLNLTGKPSMHQIPTEHAALSFKKKKKKKVTHTNTAHWQHSVSRYRSQAVSSPWDHIRSETWPYMLLLKLLREICVTGWMRNYFFFFLYMLMFAPPRLCVCVISLHNPGITIWIFLALVLLGLCCSPPSRLCEYEEWDWTPGVWSIW